MSWLQLAFKNLMRYRRKSCCGWLWAKDRQRRFTFVCALRMMHLQPNSTRSDKTSYMSLPPFTICADSGPNICAGQWYLRQNLCWPRSRAQIANFSKKFKISIFGFFAGQVPVNEIFRYGCQGVKICATFVLANGIFR